MSFLKKLGGLGGSLLGGPVGGVLGGLAGSGLSRLLGSRRDRSSSGGSRDDARSRLLDQLGAGAMGPLTSNPGFLAGSGALREQLGQQADLDAGRAAATGLRGGEMDVAQAGARGQALSSGLAALLGQAGHQQFGQQGLLLRGLEGDEERRLARRQSSHGLLGSLAGSVAGALPDLLFPGQSS